MSSLLNKHKAGPIKLAGVLKDNISGWVRPLGIDRLDLPFDAAWDLSHCQVDDGFLLRLRLERRRVPASLLAVIYRQKFAESEAKSGKAPGPKERRELKESLRIELMGRALPTVAHVDAFWRDIAGELTLFATGKAQREIFESLFSASFGSPLELTLVRLDPPLIGLSLEAWLDEDVASQTFGRLAALTPISVAAPAHP